MLKGAENQGNYPDNSCRKHFLFVCLIYPDIAAKVALGEGEIGTIRTMYKILQMLKLDTSVVTMEGRWGGTCSHSSLALLCLSPSELLSLWISLWLSHFLSCFFYLLVSVPLILSSLLSLSPHLSLSLNPLSLDYLSASESLTRSFSFYLFGSISVHLFSFSLSLPLSFCLSLFVTVCPSLSFPSESLPLSQTWKLPPTVLQNLLPCSSVTNFPPCG